MQSCFKQSSYSFYCNTVSSTVLGCSKLIKIMLCFVWFVFLFFFVFYNLSFPAAEVYFKFRFLIDTKKQKQYL